MTIYKALGTFSVSVFCREVNWTYDVLLIEFLVPKNYGNDS